MQNVLFKPPLAFVILGNVSYCVDDVLFIVLDGDSLCRVDAVIPFYAPVCFAIVKKSLAVGHERLFAIIISLVGKGADVEEYLLGVVGDGACVCPFRFVAAYLWQELTEFVLEFPILRVEAYLVVVAAGALVELASCRGGQLVAAYVLNLDVVAEVQERRGVGAEFEREVVVLHQHEVALAPYADLGVEARGSVGGFLYDDVGVHERLLGLGSSSLRMNLAILPL